MNNTLLTGRLTRDPNMSYTQDQKPVARFTLAVDRGSRDGGADFISCVAYDKTADVIGQYCKKGRLIGVQGKIRTGSYQKQDGTKVYTTEVAVDRMEFLGGREESAPQYQTAQAAAPAPAPQYQTTQAPPPRPQQQPLQWYPEPIQPDADLPF